MKDEKQTVENVQEKLSEYVKTNDGSTYFELKRLALDARKTFPQSFDAAEALAYVHAYGREYDRAVVVFSECCRLAPKHAMSYYNRGVNLCHLGEVDKARLDFETARDLDPTSALPLSMLAYCYLQKNRPDNAFSLAQKAVRIDRKLAIAHYYVGKALHMMEPKPSHVVVAEMAFLRAATLDPNLAASAFANTNAKKNVDSLSLQFLGLQVGGRM